MNVQRMVAVTVLLACAGNGHAGEGLVAGLAAKGLDAPPTVLRIAQASLETGNAELAARQACLVADDPRVGANAMDVVAKTGFRCDALPVADPSEVVSGALDREVIDRRIRRRMGEIRFCYRVELTKTQDLEGKVVERFVIAADGTVAGAAGSWPEAPDDRLAPVASCLDDVFEEITFPRPRGGGIVIVSYPFMFSPLE